MKYLITTLILMMTLFANIEAQTDSTYWQYADGILEVKDHPDSLVGFNWANIQVKTAFNVNTGDLYSLNPTDTSWTLMATINNVSDSVNIIETVSISGSNLSITQSNGPGRSTNIAQYVGAILSNTDPFGTTTPQYAGKFYVDTLGTDSVYISIGTTAADWLLIHP